MSCQPIMQRAVRAVLQPVLTEIETRVQGLVDRFNRELQGAGLAPQVPLPTPEIPPGVLLAAEAGAAIGAFIRPLVPEVAPPTALVQQNNQELVAFMGRLLSLPPQEAIAAAAEVEGCIEHTLSGLISGHLLADALR